MPRSLDIHRKEGEPSIMPDPDPVTARRQCRPRQDGHTDRARARARGGAVPLAGGVALALALISAPPPGSAEAFPDPEARTAEGADALIAAAHPDATQAGARMLAEGGSAADAAIAAQLMLTLVEPQSSGIGGGAFLLHHDAGAEELLAYDGRETAPEAIDETLFLDADGEPQDFLEAVVGGDAVGTPGLMRMLERVHEAHGELPWAQLFEPAMERAREGFPVSPRLHEAISRWEPDDFEAARRYFFTDAGEPLPAGERLRNPELARSLERLAEQGADALYEGALAEAIVDAVQEAGGALKRSDLADYRAEVRAPVCAPYAGHRVCGMPPPSSGGVSVLQILQLQSLAAERLTPASDAERYHLLAEASRLAFADRDRYLGDPEHADPPVAALLDRDYLAERAARIEPESSLGRAEPGLDRDDGGTAEGHRHGRSTSHLSVIDEAGNAVALTTSVEMPFGSRLMAGGFILNNQLTDFDFEPRDAEGAPVPNRPAPGKRPLSSMAPTVAYGADGELRLAIGSPGGTRIIGYVAQRTAAVLEHGEPLDEAIQAGSVINRNGPTELEAGTEREALAEPLRERGHEVEIRRLTSGLHAVERTPAGQLRGAADPRREGVVLAPAPTDKPAEHEE